MHYFFLNRNNILLAFIFILLSCKNDKVVYINSSQPASKVSNNVRPKTKKFVYAKFLIKEPVLKQRRGSYNSRLNDFESENYIDWQEKIILTNIKTIENYNSDSEYIFLDNIEKNIQKQVDYSNINFRGNLTIKLRYVEEIEKFENYRASIKDRKFLAFDSYKDASIHKSQKGNSF